ncbi:hypothetical protein [Homoserinimonas sp. A520]
MRIFGTPDAEYYVSDRVAELVDTLSAELSATGCSCRVTVPAHMLDQLRESYVRDHWAEILLPAQIRWGRTESALEPKEASSAVFQIAAALHELAPSSHPRVESPYVPEGSGESRSDSWDYVRTVTVDGV